MKGIIGYAVGAAVLTVLGSLSLATSRLERQMVRVQETLVTSDYDASNAALETVQDYYEYASRLPWIGIRPLNDVRARKAALQYWQRQYSALTPVGRTDPVADVSSDNVPLQLIVANALYRREQAQAKDHASTLAALDAGINAYLKVLTNAERQEDAPYAEQAAYNYEYLARLRDEVRRRRRERPAVSSSRPLGAEGHAEEATFKGGFKTYVPLEKKEREDGDAGKVGPGARKG